MKTAGKIWMVSVGLALSLSGVLSSCAQGSYNQPNNGQPGYNRPDYDQQGYNDGYNNQPGYDQSGAQPDFYTNLAPHGQWVQTPEYGRVWIPNAGPDFQPYATNGHWVVTEYGNTWVSDYAWGWAPFHYGRWYQDRYRGWAWVPGNEWGPAWVSWRSGGGYYGWAPLTPGLNINVNFNIPANYWVFVPQAYITSPRIYSYYVPRPRVVNIYQNTTIINNVYRNNNRAYAYGPRRDEIERVTRQSVPVYRIENTNRPGRDVVGNGSVGIYRPEANRSSRGNADSRVYNAPFDNNRPDNSRNNGARVDSPNAGTYNDRNRSSRGNAGTYNNGNTGPNMGSNGARVEAPTPGTYTERSSRGNAGTYNNGNTGSNPIDVNPSYPQRSQSSRGGGSYNRPNYEAQQNVPMPQTAPQPSQSSPQPGRMETPAQGGWNRGSRQESAPAPQRDGGRVGTAQPQQEQRSQAQPQPQGGYQSGRGSSRGPR